MFIKRVKPRGISYLQMVEGYWEDGRVKHRLLKSLGREDQLDPEMIDRLRASLKRYASKDTSGVAEFDLDAISVPPDRRFRFDVANVIKAIVFQRVLDPGSERSFLPSVFAPEFDGIKLQHAYRALQFLAEVGPELGTRFDDRETLRRRHPGALRHDQHLLRGRRPRGAR